MPRRTWRFQIPVAESQTILLRLAAFLVDSLSLAILLILPASLASYAIAWFGGSLGVINVVWGSALLILVLAIVLRDGYHGRSLGKRLLGLRLVTPSGRPCGYWRSLLRNLPLIVPVWNAIDVILVLVGRPRTGDRMARTFVLEE